MRDVAALLGWAKRPVHATTDTIHHLHYLRVDEHCSVDGGSVSRTVTELQACKDRVLIRSPQYTNSPLGQSYGRIFLFIPMRTSAVPSAPTSMYGTNHFNVRYSRAIVNFP